MLRQSILYYHRSKSVAAYQNKLIIGNSLCQTSSNNLAKVTSTLSRVFQVYPGYAMVISSFNFQGRKHNDVGDVLNGD